MKSVSFFKGLSWLIALNLLVKPVWIFFIDRQVQNIVGFEAYGKYFAAFNLSLVFFFIADAGLSNMLNQKVAAGNQLNIVQLFKIKVGMILGYVALCTLAGLLAGIDQWQLFIYIIGVQALTSLFLFLRSLVTANQYFTADAFFSVFDKLLMVILCGGFIYGSWGKINLLLFLQLQVACTVIGVAAATVFLASKKIIVSGPRESTRVIFKLVAPFAAIILLMSLHYRADGFLLERLHPNGAFEAGVYASAYRLLDAANMGGYLVASFLVPFVAKNWHDPDLLNSTVLKSRHLLMIPGVTIIAIMIVFAPWIQQLLYHSDAPYNSGVLQICLAILPAYYLVHIYGSVLTATAHLRSFIAVLTLSVVMNLLLNLILIPMYGALGCCIAALASQYVCAIVLHVTACSSTGLVAGWTSYAGYILLGGLLTGLLMVGKQLTGNVWLIIIITCFIALVAAITQISYFRKKFFFHA